MTHKSYFHAGPNNARFMLFKSRKSGLFKVRLAEPNESANWDYDDELDAHEMTSELVGAKSFEECLERLGLHGYSR
jgi:hypothetical protein